MINSGDEMSVWERFFDAETLKKAKNEVRIKNVQRTAKQILAQTAETNYKLKAPIKYNSPYHPTCSCEKKSGCEHEAALRYYIDEHPELLQKTEDIKKIVNTLDKKSLKEFLIKELEQNTILSINFLKDFDNKKEVDKEKYHSKLSSILKKGEGPDFFLHHIYDFERLEVKLKRFMTQDINQLLKNGEYELGWELLCTIADVLNDELSINQDAWYNLTEIYSDYANPLLESLYLTKEQINTLETKTLKITKFL